MEQEKNLLEEKLRATSKPNEKIFKLKEEKNFNSSYSNSSGKSKYASGNVSIYKSSFHSQKATKHSLEHMERESKVTYLLEHDSSVNDNIIYEDVEKFKKKLHKFIKKRFLKKCRLLQRLT